MLEIRNEAERAEILLYGDIGQDMWGEGNSAEDFAGMLNSLSPKPLDIRIDSCGGDVYEAFAMCSAIQRYEGETCAYIDGLAASAASYIAVVCDRVVMNDYAFLMIHNAWTMTAGNADYLEQAAHRLRCIDNTIAAIYAKRSDYSEDEIHRMMDAETWLTADDCLTHGFAQTVYETEERMAAHIDPQTAARFRDIPKAISIRNEAEEESISHTPNTMDEKVEEPTASYLVIDGQLLRKGTQDA